MSGGMTGMVLLAAARFLSRVAALALLAMVAVNVIDVGLRAGFNAPIFGTYEIVELLLAAVAFLAIPETFLRGEHITIELIDQLVPASVVAWLRAFGSLAAFVFLALLGWHMIEPAWDFVRFNEVTIDLHIPMIWKAVPVVLAIGAGAIAVCGVFLRDIAQAGRRRQ